VTDSLLVFAITTPVDVEAEGTTEITPCSSVCVGTSIGFFAGVQAMETEVCEETGDPEAAGVSVDSVTEDEGTVELV
jgi:hypothetical protein